MGAVWEGWFTVVVVFGAFGCLLKDVVQPDHVMIGALTILMAAGVVSVEEGLAGFSNEGLLTVATLFVVAAGISATGGLDWYMGKLLGKPRTTAGAQLRLMVPIALTSAFLNNTPVVAVMIPIVQRWAENISIPKEQVMIPLSFASILGGTCTLIGTSTNLVVLGMLQQWKGADGLSTQTYDMGLFDLGLYGIPCALTGMTYILLASRVLLPKGKSASEASSRRRGDSSSGDGGGGGTEDLIVGARLQPWSAAVGKTVGASGLRGLPGLYLVSVKRDETLVRAVGPEFVLNQGDVLYFTGMVENLGTVCGEHGLEAMTAEHDEDTSDEDLESGSEDDADEDDNDDLIVGLGSNDSGNEERVLGGSPSEIAGVGSAGVVDSGQEKPLTNTSPAKLATKTRSSKKPKQNPPVTIPTAVPEMSELMEIQMMARSQAIGGVAGGGWDGTGGAGKTVDRPSSHKKNAADDSDTSATSEGGESETGGFSGGFSPRGGAWSDGEGDDCRTTAARDASATTSVRRTQTADGAGGSVEGSHHGKGHSTNQTVRRRRTHRRVSNAHAEFASAVSVDPGERRALKLYDRQRRDSGGFGRHKTTSAKEKRDKEVAQNAALRALGPPRVTVEIDPDVANETATAPDGTGTTTTVTTLARSVLGVSAIDRPGLLHDISQGLNRLRVQLLHCEASVVANRSVSIWRLQNMDQRTTRDEIRTVIESLLSPLSGSAAAKEKGQNVLRVRVRKGSSLIGRVPAQVNFRSTYGAAIVAMQRGGRAPLGKLGQVSLQENDVLVLQLNEVSPLLSPVPGDLNLTGAGDGGDGVGDGVHGTGVGANGFSHGTVGTTPQKSQSSLQRISSSMGSMVGISSSSASSSSALKDTRGFSLRAKIPQTTRVLDGHAVAIVVDGAGGTASGTAGVGDRKGSPEKSGRGPADDGSVVVAIPDTRGYSIRAPIGDNSSNNSASNSATSAKEVAIRKAHRDLEIVANGNGAEAGKEFLIAVRVEKRSQFVKKTADEAGLRTLPGLFLVSIERKRSGSNQGLGQGGVSNATAVAATVTTAGPATVGHAMGSNQGSGASNATGVATVPTVAIVATVGTPAVDSVDSVDPADDPLCEDDVLWYAGNARDIASVRKIPGLTPHSADQLGKLEGVNSQERRLIQAVVAKTGPLVGKSIREIKFRTRYNAVVLAVHREGARVHARIGDVILHPGDVLLLDAGPDFHREAVNNSGSGFALVSVLEDSAPPRLRLLVPVLVIAIAMIAVYTAGVTPLLVAAIFAAAIMIACGALSEQEARNAIKWDVIVTIAAAFGMSKALQNSGVASAVATTLVSLAESSGTGTVGLLTAVYFATFLISNVVTNNAAAALMFPIAAEAAEKAGFPLMAISFIVMLAASASFMSPFGYQTNLMVYGPGGYVFADFLRFGVPMQIVQLVVSVAVIALGSKLWWVSWGATAAAFGATCSFMILEKTPLEYFVSAKNEILKRFGNCTRRGAGRSTDGIDRV